MKRGWSIPVQVYLQLKDRKSWIEGLTSKQLQDRVKSSINDYRRRNEIKVKKISLGSIYGAISSLNLFCEHIHIRTDFRFRKVCLKCHDNYTYESYETNCLKCERKLEIIKENRYFTIHEGEDFEKKKREYIQQMLRSGFKKGSLEIYEEHEVKNIEKIQKLKEEVSQ